MKWKTIDGEGNIKFLDEDKKHFIAIFHSTGYNINLGISISLELPNIEIHVPFGFFRIGWVREIDTMIKEHKFLYKTFGYNWE